MTDFLKRHSGVVDFNKEILMGEIGALLGVQLFSYVSSKIYHSPEAISFFAVLGAIFFSSLFFLGMRIYHYDKRNDLSIKKTIKDVSYYAPGSLVIVFLFYYPLLFLVSRSLLGSGVEVSLAVFLSQVVAFFYFLIFINIYRLSLKKFFKVVL